MAKKQEGGPAWLATFADLMSLLMAFFVMLFAMSSVEKEKYHAVVQSLTETLNGGDELSDAQKQYFGSESGKKNATPTPIDDLKPLYDSLIQTYRDKLYDKKMNLQMEDNGKRIRITFPSSLAFPPGTSRLTPEFIRELAKLPSWQNEPVIVKVLGHTDSRPIRRGRFHSNWELSASRAAEVILALSRMHKLRPNQAMAIGLADTRPLDPNPTEEAYRKNRRVEIVVEKQPPKEAKTETSTPSLSSQNEVKQETKPASLPQVNTH